MLLTITTTYQPASDLGYLLHKHPDRLQSFPFAFGTAHVFYPVVEPARCSVSLLLEIDSIALVRDRRAPAGENNDAYVNDRPYVASSFMSVAINEVFRSALNGHCQTRPTLVDQTLPLSATLTVVPCQGGAGLINRLFEPLGYQVTAEPHQLDEQFADWGASRYWSITLQGGQRLADLLAHLYVLLPVLDDEKHYWVGRDEIEKLLRRGEGWLADHPERTLITTRYLRYRAPLTREALRRLSEEDELDPDTSSAERAAAEIALESGLSLHQQRLAAVVDQLTRHNARRVVDLGCGEGRLIKLLLDISQFSFILGLDVSHRALEQAQRRLRLDTLPTARRERVQLIHGALTYRDRRLAGFDAAVAVEVIEHLDPARLTAFERAIFRYARPGRVIVTTPNHEYNVRFTGLATGAFRHHDHRFEWTRAEFAAWAASVAQENGYRVTIESIGPVDETCGAPSQMAIFSRLNDAQAVGLE